MAPPRNAGPRLLSARRAEPGKMVAGSSSPSLRTSPSGSAREALARHSEYKPLSMSKALARSEPTLRGMGTVGRSGARGLGREPGDAHARGRPQPRARAIVRRLVDPGAARGQDRGGASGEPPALLRRGDGGAPGGGGAQPRRAESNLHASGLVSSGHAGDEVRDAGRHGCLGRAWQEPPPRRVLRGARSSASNAPR